MEYRSKASLCIQNIYRIKWSSKGIAETSRKCSLRHSRDSKEQRQKGHYVKSPFLIQVLSLARRNTNQDFSEREMNQWDS